MFGYTGLLWDCGYTQEKPFAAHACSGTWSGTPLSPALGFWACCGGDGIYFRASYLRGGQNIQGADWYGGWSFIGSDGDIIGVLGKYGIISDRIVFLCAFLGGGAGYFQERARIPGSLCAISCRGTVISDIGFAIGGVVWVEAEK